ncbi:uncharacterized protein B0H18DRAFT_1023351 [Fomitopsis serialis]|uniref:uncharacterized protein n=1 Tax=Fomitopsis serialis TaxID=139415 RepID=UPI002007E4F2|nr:uncharacterized protein B0H18DRAFT_1023351 [Neoantrodia serialis]KAH9920689.1 hypothetical protein B0H18DRAFT_1023351 [Neoantrodia serialis]
MLAQSCFKRIKPHFWGSDHLVSLRGHARQYSKQSSDGSIFSESESPWDKVFENIEEDSPVLHPGSARRPQTSSPLPARSPRKQAMTAREVNAFDQMFNMIFDAVSKPPSKDSKRPDVSARSSTSVGIGRARSQQMSDLFGKLRRQSKHLRWTSEADEELDKKKEAMELCDTDQQLLEWAMREVFDESTRCEENARKASEDPSTSKRPAQLQPPWYPQTIALLMQTFREKYDDPHLALSIFDHARHLSVVSFVFGCTTPVYNELIETRWRCFRDLRGACEALEEMRVNGVEVDGRTLTLAEKIRREVGERNMWHEESTIGSGEVWDMVARIEQLVSQPTGPRRIEKQRKSRTWSPTHSKKWSSANEVWKGTALEEGESSDGWKFDNWEPPSSTAH